MKNNNKKQFYTITELAGILNISRQAIFKRIKNGQLKAEIAGNSYIINKKDLSDIIDDNLTDKIKSEINKGIAKVIKEYGDTLKMLGNE